MTDPEHQIGQPFTAERGNRQPLDLPMDRTHGEHRGRYDEIALRRDKPTTPRAFFCGLPPTSWPSR